MRKIRINTGLAFILLFIFLFACISDQEQQSEESILPNIEDTTSQPLINSLGDTIPTGVEIAVSPKTYRINEIMDVKVVRAGEPIVIPAHPNKIIKEKLEIKSIKVDLEVLFEPVKEDNSNPASLVNSLGDTIPTGVPIPALGKRVPIKWPKPISALPPIYRDNATLDIKSLGIKNGLSSNWIHALHQDSRGLYWFGTYGGGVNLYDGVNLWHFKKENGLTDNIIYSIHEDRQGRIWFGTDGGLMYYNGIEFIHFNEMDGYANNRTEVIIEDQQGNLWFGSLNYGLCKYDGGSFTYYFEKQGCKARFVTSIFEDKPGELWIVTRHEGLLKFDGSVFTQLQLPDTWKEKLKVIYKDTKGTIWIGTQNGIYTYDGQHLTHHNYQSGCKIQSITEDTQGNIWIGGRFHGLVKYDGQFFTCISVEQGMSNKLVYDIHIDGSGVIWLATYGGVNIFKPNSFKHPKILSNAIFRSIFQDSRGNLWFGTEGDGVYKYDGKDYFQYTEDQGFFPVNSAIWAIEEDFEGNMWFGAIPGGLVKFDGQAKLSHETHKFTYYIHKEKHNNVIGLQKDKYNNLWIAYDGDGLLRIDGSHVYDITEGDGLINNKITPPFIEDHQGDLWVTTIGGGATKIHNGIRKGELTLINYSRREGLSNEHITEIMPGRQGGLWLSDRSGKLFRYQKESEILKSQMFTRLDLRKIRGKSSIHSMIQDPDGQIWISGNSGLDRLTFDTTNYTGIAGLSSSYSDQDGLKALNFYHPVLLDKINRIWWSTGKGIAQLDMRRFKESNSKPTIHLNEIEINGLHYDYRNRSESLTKDLEYDSISRFSNIPTYLQLSYRLNSLTFRFSGLDWPAPHHLRYSYYLDGISDDWSLPAKTAYANFQMLPHGEYTFKIRALGKSNQWSETLSYSFVIYPPLWLTWWAKGLYGLFGILAVIGIIYLSIRKVKKRNRLLESNMRERAVAERELKKSEEKFRGVFDSMVDVFSRSDMEGKCMMISPSIYDLLGYRPEEIIGKHLSDFYVDPNQRFEIVKKLKKSNKVENFEIDTLHKDGGIITISTNAKLYYDTSGKTLGVEAVFRDITAQKKAQSEHDKLFNVSFDLLCIAGMDGYFKELNPAWETALGYSLDELYKKPFNDFIHPEDLENTTKEIGKLEGGAVSLDFENRYITRSGKVINLSWTAIAVPEESLMYCIARDVTEKKKSENDVLEHQNRLRALVHELTIVEERIRKQIAADLHDNVGQLLTSSRMQLARVKSMEENPELIVRLNSISESLLKAVQVTRSAIFELSPPQLLELGLFAAIEDWMILNVEKNYQILTFSTKEGDEYHLDENTRLLIFRCVTELGSNVIKHSRARELKVHFKIKDKILEISVEDDGIGLEYNSEKLSSNKQAFGLFSIQERMIDLGGTMKINSFLNKGTIVKLSIPIN